MRRKLFTLAAGGSGVLCVGGCVLWFGSSRGRFPDSPADSVHSYNGQSWNELASLDGGLYFLHVTGFEIPDSGADEPYPQGFRRIGDHRSTPSLLWIVLRWSPLPPDRERS